LDLNRKGQKIWAKNFWVAKTIPKNSLVKGCEKGFGPGRVAIRHLPGWGSRPLTGGLKKRVYG